MQINPDGMKVEVIDIHYASFQSYQFMQINPDMDSNLLIEGDTIVFQSYQFMQINPDRFHFYIRLILGQEVSIVSIHADQSRRLNDELLIGHNIGVSIVSIHADQSRLS